jgi:exosortase A-associated hydrolase 1
MTRRHFLLACEGENLAATLDEAAGKVGLLIVTGGNETRAGAFAGQAHLAARIAALGYPVLRFDRRGVGDSSGTNALFTGSAPDIAAALAAFRKEQPQVQRVVAFGNCDGASALMLQAGAGCDALVLANPWTFDAADEAPPPAAIRQRYAAKLANPREVWRLLTGGVSLRKLAGGLQRALRPAPPPSSLTERMQAAMAGYAGKATYLLAATDRTAQAFMAAWPSSVGHWQVCDGAGHSFAEAHAQQWLDQQLASVLEGQALFYKETGQLHMG